MVLAENLKKVRTELGLSVAKFAEKLEMSANTLTNYEQNRREPSLNLFVQLDKKINVNLNWLVSGNGEMFENQRYCESDEEFEKRVIEVMKKHGIIRK